MCKSGFKFHIGKDENVEGGIERLIHDPKKLTVQEGVILFEFQSNGEFHSNPPLQAMV